MELVSSSALPHPRLLFRLSKKPYGDRSDRFLPLDEHVLVSGAGIGRRKRARIPRDGDGLPPLAVGPWKDRLHAPRPHLARRALRCVLEAEPSNGAPRSRAHRLREDELGRALWRRSGRLHFRSCTPRPPLDERRTLSRPQARARARREQSERGALTAEGLGPGRAERQHAPT